MAKHHEFSENDDGVHLQYGEFSLCGDAFDISAVTDEIDDLAHTKKRTVTCERCIAIIRYCRGARIPKDTET